MKGPSEYGQDTEKLWICSINNNPTHSYLVFWSLQAASRRVLAFHSLLVKSLSFFKKTNVHFLPLETSQAKWDHSQVYTYKLCSYKYLSLTTLINLYSGLESENDDCVCRLCFQLNKYVTHWIYSSSLRVVNMSN